MFLEWEASSYVTNPKKLRSKKFIFSTHRDLKRSEAEGTPCTTPHGLGRSSAKHLGIKLQQKKTKPFKQEILEVGIIYLGDSGPKWRISQGSLLQKMDCYKKKWMAGGYDRPVMGDPSIWGEMTENLMFNLPQDRETSRSCLMAWTQPSLQPNSR